MILGYTIYDIDVAWKTLLDSIRQLSDGTLVPVFFEVQKSDIRYTTYPQINVSLIGVVPWYEAREGWDDRIAGYTLGKDDIPLTEIVVRQPEPFILQYRISSKVKNPMHRTDLMLRMMLTLTPIPQLKMEHLEGRPSVHARFDDHYGSTPEASEESAKVFGEEEVIHDIWTYLVYASFPHPEVQEDPVAKMITWRMQNIQSLSDGVSELTGPDTQDRVRVVDIP